MRKQRKNIADNTVLLFEYNYFLNEAEEDTLDLGDESLDTNDSTNPEEDVQDQNQPMSPQPEEEEVEEVDITELVNKQNELLQQIEEFKTLFSEKERSAKEDFKKSFEQELTKVSDLMSSTISDHMQKLELEIKKRIPTPEEELTLRSLSSYPYNLKVSDYFETHDLEKQQQKEKLLSPTPQQPQEQEDSSKKQEYILTRRDIEQNFSDFDIKKSF